MARSIRRAGLVLMLALLGVPAIPAAGAGTHAGSGSAAGPPCASPVLDRPLPGTRALSALGSSGLARAAGASSDRAGRLAARLAADRTLWLDRCGKQFYVDATEPAAQAAVADVAPAAPFPYDQTFALHSRPGSLRTIYLDFGGATISGTAWNDTVASFSAPAYDTDGSPSTFSTAERDVIQSVWQRVAEDYAPFDVDVTTADPGTGAITRSSSSDQVYGTRLLVTKTNGPGSDCSCGGIAYVGVFDDTYSHDYYQPAFVFYPAVSGAKSIAEAAAHEVGHTLGLSHDGTATAGYYLGQGAWAPIMGAGYYHPVSQWSRGEYAGANNTEDDLSIIATHGAAFRADDHGDSAATATPIDPASPTASGVIGRPTDRDWFSFASGGGATTVSVTPAPTGPDLDVSLSVYAADGTRLATVDPASSQISADSAAGLAATYTSSTLTAGTYYVAVDGVGHGDVLTTGYSDYGSLGQYTVTVSTSSMPPVTPPLTPPPTPPAPVTSPSITTAALPAATRGAWYAARPAASGGTGPYTWSRTSGALPAGLALNPTGTISGRATTTGRYDFRVAVTDSAGRRATRDLEIRVAARPRITTAALPAGRRHRGYLARLARAGGTPAYRWVVSAGRLPAGLRLTARGVIRGYPRTRGRWTVTVTLIDHWRAAGRRSYTVRVR